MNPAAQTIVRDTQELFIIVMDLYAVYLEEIERLIQEVPETEIQLLAALNAELTEIQGALEHDIGIFDHAIQSDLEDIHQFRDQLKINDLYKMLKS